MKIVKNRNIFFIISGLLILASFILIFFVGLPLGIDFTGGSLMEIEFSEKRPSIDEIEKILKELDLGEFKIQPIGEKGFVFRLSDISENKHQEIISKLNEFTDLSKDEAQIFNEEDGKAASSVPVSGAKNVLTENRFDSVGPVIGQELKQKTIYAITITLIAIVLYIAWAFRAVSRPISSWKYGIVAIITLFHDLIITLGIFLIFARIFGFELNTSFVAAILTILGYSVNDTIVVFDRIRENLKDYNSSFEETVEKSVRQTIIRSVNTSTTTLLVLLAILFFGGTTIQDFIMSLIIGVVIGTYSSIFIASPFLVAWEKFRK